MSRGWRGRPPEELEERTKKVEDVKKTTNRAAKVLDQAIKEVATHVSSLYALSYLVND